MGCLSLISARFYLLYCQTVNLNTCVFCILKVTCVKFFQELPESHRADAVSSMVYEANARIRDPVYGCAGAICQLQKHVSELQAQLAKTQAELLNMQCQQGNLIALICMDMTQSKDPILQQQQQQSYLDTSCFLDETNLGTAWEPLWT